MQTYKSFFNIITAFICLLFPTGKEANQRIQSYASSELKHYSTQKLTQRIMRDNVDLVYHVRTKNNAPAGQIILRYGDITQYQADVIVNATNELLHVEDNTTIASPQYERPRGNDSDRYTKIENVYASCLSLAMCVNAFHYTSSKGMAFLKFFDEQWLLNHRSMLTFTFKTPIISIAFPPVSTGFLGFNIDNSTPYALHAIIVSMQYYAHRINELELQNTLQPFTVIIYFYETNPSPTYALPIYIESLNKTLDEQYIILHPNKLLP